MEERVQWGVTAREYGTEEEACPLDDVPAKKTDKTRDVTGYGNFEKSF